MLYVTLMLIRIILHVITSLKVCCGMWQVVPGVISILDTYWELIPAATTAGFIACIVDDLVRFIAFIVVHLFLS